MNDNIIKLQCLSHLLGDTLRVLEDYTQTEDLPLTVRNNLASIISQARERQQEIVLFGETYEKSETKEEDDQTVDQPKTVYTDSG